ncbi:hypothetical protein IE81DRAFT_195666 [Ceraceosorus guamensis]|uniref:Uncharacterized protein n=1 Tax=Ceraceosorus guamensis TaxID=1522189 RepID=A0A316VZY5_9BASI|nr:hypothetical protein IE81DRAFT_195666 [Ceraceosorus guamensis]PWN41045.1 hypothetical protein IE81DRAFT_195666 [Ceraceosorus guamensis]
MRAAALLCSALGVAHASHSSQMIRKQTPFGRVDVDVGGGGGCGADRYIESRSRVESAQADLLPFNHNKLTWHSSVQIIPDPHTHIESVRSNSKSHECKKSVQLT